MKDPFKTFEEYEEEEDQHTTFIMERLIKENIRKHYNLIKYRERIARNIKRRKGLLNEIEKDDTDYDESNLPRDYEEFKTMDQIKAKIKYLYSTLNRSDYNKYIQCDIL